MNFNNTSLPSPVQIKTFDSFRKNIFYLKADIPFSDSRLQSLINNKDRLISSEIVSKIFQFVLHKTPDNIMQDQSQSTLHVLYKVSIVKKNYFIKINVIQDEYQEISFFQEQWIAEKLERIGLSYTPIVFVDVTKKIIPFDFMIMEEAKGKSLHNQSLSKNMEKIIFSSLGKYIAKLHTVKTKNYGQLSMIDMIKNKINVGLSSSWKAYLFLHISNHLEICLQRNVIDINEKNQIQEVFYMYINILQNISPVLLHNDLGGYNIFFNDKNVTSLIDWEDAISGDPIYDIANFGTFNYRPQHKNRITYFLNGYESIQLKPQEFEKRYWLYYLRIAIMKAVVKARQGNTDTSYRIQESLKQLTHFTRHPGSEASPGSKP